MYTVYGSHQCKFCNMACEHLMASNKPFTYVDIRASEKDREKMHSLVFEATGEYPKTIPQIFKDDEYIGGYSELVG